MNRTALVTGGLAVLAIALLGGSSRPDAVQAMALQPLAILAAGAMFFTLRRGDLAGQRLPLLLLGAYAALLVVQLVPLPFGLWSNLPGREDYARIVTVFGDAAARPLTLVPWRTLNALTSVGVPLAALLIYAAWREAAAKRAAIALIAIAAVNAVLGLAQAALPGASALYPYAVTNVGAPVGLFANQNHTAIFQAIALVVIAAIATRRDAEVGPGTKIALACLGALVLVSGLVNGSRIGLVALAIALATCGALVFMGRAAKAAGAHGAAGAQATIGGPRVPPLAIAGGLAAAFALLVALFWWSGRIPGLSRLLEDDSFGDLRLKTLPVLADMLGDLWLVGSGIGSFEALYRSYEPLALLQPDYLNQAHNDVLQFAIEAGVVGVALLGVLGWWLVRALGRMARSAGPARGDALAAGACLAMLVFGSLTDYPLRTGLAQLAGVWLIAFIADRAAREQVHTARFQSAPGRL